MEVAYGPDMVKDSKVDRIIELNQEITRRLAAMGNTSFLDLMPFRNSSSSAFYHHPNSYGSG